MKKLLLVFISTFIFGCSGDDDSVSSNSDLVGKWTSTNVKETEIWKETSRSTTEYVDEIMSGEVIYEFVSNGKMIIHNNANIIKETTYKNGNKVETETFSVEHYMDEGTWKKEGDSIKIKFYEYEGEIHNVDFSENTFNLMYERYEGSDRYNKVEATLTR